MITGASSGIGRALALEFAPRSQALVLVARRIERLERLRDELVARHPSLKAVTFAADLSGAQKHCALISQEPALS
jgi:short-subunit dehydrogenase